MPKQIDLPYLLMVKKETRQRRCPDPIETFGITLGYATYFELIATLVILLLLRAMGCVHTVDKNEGSLTNTLTERPVSSHV